MKKILLATFCYVQLLSVLSATQHDRRCLLNEDVPDQLCR